MEIRDLKSFMSVVEQGSYTKAAQTYFVSQPSLSKSIKKLEDGLQIELLDRSTRHVVLTDAGRIVYEQGQRILKSVEDIHSLLEDLMNIKSGTIKIGMPPLIGRMFFPKIARSFSIKYPKVKLELIERGAKLIGSMVESGQVEVVRVGKARRAKLYYLRDRVGKAAKTKEKLGARIENKEITIKEDLVEEAPVEEITEVVEETVAPVAEEVVATEETPEK